jgi:5-(carboxyamino)imidazole ribonucleotide synthase
VINPGQQIGVLGGGQLGLFFTTAAKRLGYRVVVWDPDPHAPARSCADVFIGAAFDDAHAMRSFLQDTRAVTYEWENIPVHVVELIEKEVPVRPGSTVLGLLQNRASQKHFLSAHGLHTAQFQPVQNPQALPLLADAVGLPCLLKTATAGYDGRGQWSIESPQDALTLSEQLHHQPHAAGWLLEQRISFHKEISIIVVQSEHGDVHTYPIAENWHEHGILRMSQVPAEVDPDLTSRIISLARSAVMALGEPGVYCVELFLTHDDDILINEIAPRPHNSGHYSMEVCSISQFEQQVRMLCGLPLIAPRLLSAAVLINILGSEIQRLDAPARFRQLLSVQGATLYHYRKQAVRVGRKMGHVVVSDQEPQRAMERARTVLALLHRDM